jgi:hypothetical protein
MREKTTDSSNKEHKGQSLKNDGKGPGRKKRLRRRKKGPELSRHANTWRQIKIFAALIAVCFGTALLASVMMNTNFLSVANFMLFGSTDPYLSTDKKKEIEQEFKEEMKKLMK